MKGSLVDIAVAFVMGAAFKDVVTSFPSGIVSTVIGLIFEADFKSLKYMLEKGTVNELEVVVGEYAVMWGKFLMNTTDFFVIAFVMFLMIKGVNKLKKKEAEEVATNPTDNALVCEKRDLLKK